MTEPNGASTVVLDLRCLQDPDYACRGIGRHILALLRHAPRHLRLVGLADATLPPLLPEAREITNTVHLNAYAAGAAAMPSGRPACFILASPMTHDPLFPARLLSDPAMLRAAVVYDFIPRRFPDRYLHGPADRLGYALALRWLARCDVFAPISRSAADDLKALLGVRESAIAVTGCPLDPAFERRSSMARGTPPRHLLVVGGGDPRKNPEVVIRAHARSSLMQDGTGIPLVIAGNYGPQDASGFRAMAAAEGGRAALVEVPGQLADAALSDLYGRALALVSASRDEGFSLPLIEGMAAGAPIFASDIPAHAELVADPQCRFAPDDHAALRQILDRAVRDGGWRDAVLARQADVWPRFRADAVAGRFWDALLSRLDRRAPAILRGSRPRVALLSPLPPERSGVADYTAATCMELGKLVDLHVFTEAAAPAPLPHAASIRPLAELPHLSPGFDRVISVVGNSHFHLRIFEMLRRYGGACIAHDARMLGFYRILLGQERALAVAGKELGRSVTSAELDAWLADEGRLEALFLGEVAESATPSVVHSAVTARLFQQRYGVVPACLPFSIYRPWTAGELTPLSRAAARARLGLDSAELVIATFGYVHDCKAPVECVRAIEMLRGWGITANLHFVGGTEAYGKIAELQLLVADLGLEDRIHFTRGYVTEQIYRDYLAGADLAVQLRSYGLGGLSGALLDCAAAGLPTVTNESLGAAVGVPDYVRCIPDAISPLLLAAALGGLLESGLAAGRPEAARSAFAAPRSFAAYARGLCDILGLAFRDPPPVRSRV